MLVLLFRLLSRLPLPILHLIGTAAGRLVAPRALLVQHRPDLFVIADGRLSGTRETGRGNQRKIEKAGGSIQSIQ